MNASPQTVARQPGPPFALSAADAPPRSPLVFDAPLGEWPLHGTLTIAPDGALRSSWDAHLDALWRKAVAGDAPLLAAGFHRAYIDANRARDDIGLELLAQAWPGALVVCAASHRGTGRMLRFALPGVPMYGWLSETADVQARVTQCCDRCHTKLDDQVLLTEESHPRRGGRGARRRRDARPGLGAPSSRCGFGYRTGR